MIKIKTILKKSLLLTIPLISGDILIFNKLGHTMDAPTPPQIPIQAVNTEIGENITTEEKKRIVDEFIEKIIILNKKIKTIDLGWVDPSYRLFGSSYDKGKFNKLNLEFITPVLDNADRSDSNSDEYDSDVDQPETSGSNSEQSEGYESDSNQSEASESDTEQAEGYGADSNQSEASESDIEQAEGYGSDSDQSEISAIAPDISQELNDVFESLSKMVWLDELTIDNCKILSKIPSEIWNLKNLKSLYLKNNNLSEIPREIENLKNLEILYLHNNNLSEIPSEIWNLKNLKSLYLKNDNLSEIPRETKNLKNLELLDLSTNRLSKVPPEIGNLNNLESLNLSNNDLSEIPLEIGNLKNLLSLDLSNNKLTTIPSTIKNIYTLKLSGNNIVEFGNEIQWGIQDLIQNNYIYKYNIFRSIFCYFTDKNELERFSELFYSDLPSAREERKTPPSSRGVNYDKTITTNWRHTGNQEEPKEAIKIPAGVYDFPTNELDNHERIFKKITIEKEIPIDYTVYIPKEEVKAILVNVYGGGAVSRDYAYNPLLLNEGIAIVELNLIDLDREYTVYQQETPEDLFEKLQLSINYFLNTLKKPESLTNDTDIIQKLSNKKIFLMGHSFGGLMSIRHAELYPHTFDGYISYQGALDPILANSATVMSNSKRSGFESREWLNASQEKAIRNIVDPVLILHNFDDNNVSILAATSWYNKALEANKQNLVQFLIPERGSPGGSYVKGHDFPTDQEDFEIYGRGLVNFILKGPSPLSVMSEWRSKKYETYAKSYISRNYEKLPFIEKFKAWALRLYRYRSLQEKTMTKPQHHKSWEMFGNKDITEGTIYDALYYMENNPVFRDDDITDTMIKNMLVYHIPLFVDYYNENGTKFDDGTASKVINSDYVIKEYRKLISNAELYGPNGEMNIVKYYLLRLLCIANPPLLDKFRKEKANDPAYQKAKQEALKEFDDFIKKQTKEYPKKVWQSFLQPGLDLPEGNIKKFVERFKKENPDFGSVSK